MEVFLHIVVRKSIATVDLVISDEIFSAHNVGVIVLITSIGEL